MRLSMRGKIFGIIILLLVVAVIILGIGIYGIQSLNSEMEGIGFFARRNINLNIMDKIALERRIATDAIIASLDEVEMKNMIDKDLADTDRRMNDELRSFENNFSNPPSARQREILNTVREYWTAYVDVTSKAAALSHDNTNNKALLINEGMLDFWEAVDADLEKLANEIRDKNKDFEKYTPWRATSGTIFCVIG